MFCISQHFVSFLQNTGQLMSEIVSRLCCYMLADNQADHEMLKACCHCLHEVMLYLPFRQIPCQQL